METIFSSQLFTILSYIIVVIFKILYALVIYFKIKCDNKKTRNVLTFLSIPFPIVTGIICIAKYKKNIKDIIIVLITLIFSLVSVIAVGFIFTNDDSNKYYDKDRTVHSYASDIVFTDTEGNKYAFDFEKSGYDRLYINSTDEYLNADLCYIDSDGYLYYDNDMSITAKNEKCCIDTDGSIYYPAKFTTFNKDGSIKYVYNSSNFKYDRLGNAYTHNHIPYFDEDGNKYFYTFNSNTQKGFYTKVSTGETFENEYSFVDENGYFVYDKKHSFIKQEDIENVKAYKDSSGKIYYWASGISWNEKGNLLDSFGKVIKK